ncbi:MAG: hypothetical protein A6F72_00090 [Cycloclasticus sp. symbiont of Poecilosclerida sp. N]|nr:MAG: hypothetical protein A6F72_00090 [Cycloclasticus sp. symbiont of Poecilosclerida sp. N]
MKQKILLLSVLLVPIFNANAQVEDRTTTLKQIVVTATVATDEKKLETGRLLQDHPGAVTIISKKQIEAFQPLSSIDVLKTIPGVFAPSEYGRGLRPNIGFRGMNPNRSKSGTLLAADGVPIQPAVYGDKSAYYNVPIEDVERIEVIRGGGSVLYGPGNIGGVVNYITNQPPAKQTITLKETVRDGSFFSTYLSSGDTLNNGTGYLLSYLNKSGETNRENTDTDVNNISLKVTSPDSIDGGGNWYRFNYYREVSNTPGGLSAEQFKDDPDKSVRSNDIFRGRRASADFHFDAPIKEGVDFESLAYLSFFERNWQIANEADNATYSAADELANSANIEGTAKDTGNRHFEREFFVVGVEPRIRFKNALGGKLTLGSRLHFENMNDIRRRGSSHTDRSGYTDRDSTLKTTAFAPYVEVEHAWGKLTTITGLRQEFIEQDINVGLRGGNIGKKTQAETSETVGGVGLSYKLDSDSNIYAGIHKTFEPPTFSEAVDPTTGTDKDLDSETGINSEIGFRGKLTDNLSVDAGLFYIDFDNQIISNAGESDNAGKTSHKGVEGAIVYHATPKLEINANYTYVDAKQKVGDNKGKVLPMAPKNSFNFGAIYKVNKNLSLKIDGNYVGKRFTDAENTVAESDDGNKGELPSYAILNIRGDYKVGGVSLFAGVNNIADKEYRERRQSFFGGIIPGQTRSVYVGLEAKF